MITLTTDPTSGAYRLADDERNERWTAFVTFPEDEESVEEIDVDAPTAAAARKVAEAAIERDYVEGGEICALVHRPRGVLYL